MGGRVLGTVVALIVTAGPLSAQGWIEPTPGMGTDFGVVKLRSSVTATVSGRVAQVEIEEWFENRGGALGEGDYLYPLPGEAVFSNFSLFQGDEELRGQKFLLSNTAASRTCSARMSPVTHQTTPSRSSAGSTASSS